MDTGERILLKVRAAAVALDVSPSKAYELIADGTIPSVRLGGCIRVPVDALKAWVAKQAPVASE